MEDSHKYIYFYTLDYTGQYTTIGYTLSITPFTFVPVFDDGVNKDFSKQKILWDFGDGTTSSSVTAVHNFKLPGWYNVKCHVLGKDGKSYVDSFSQNVLVKDFVTDTLVISALEYKVESGLRYPFVLYRFNSWQTYPAVSNIGYTINLNVSGNVAPLLNVDTYKKDKWGHLKPYAKFETSIYNEATNKNEIMPVNTVVTDNNKELYVKILNNSLVFCDKTDYGSCFTGTSGSKLIYYTDDTPQVIPHTPITKPSTIIVSFDRKKFVDFDNYNKNYGEKSYSILNGVFDYNIPSSIIEQLYPYNLVITSNGLDDDNNKNRIHTFDIYQEKFTNQKIPFVIRMKEFDGAPSKYNPILIKNENTELSSNEVNILLIDSINNPITEGITIVSDLGSLSSESYGGYFKGYLISSKEYNDIRIYAETPATIIDKFIIDTIYAVIAEPQADKIHNVKVIRKDGVKILEDITVNVSGLTGIYSSCITAERLKDGSTKWNMWVVDSDREKILKLNPENIVDGNMEIIYSDFILPEDSSPSNIASDRHGNVWVTLYDSVSTVRINNLSNTIDNIVTPSIVNDVIDYENTITPASVDVDKNDNIWISYSNQLSSFIEKYNSGGTFIKHIKILDGYQCTEILTDLNSNVWGIAKDLTTDDEDFTKKIDKIFKIDTNYNVTYYTASGSLGNITLDLNGNIWFTKNINLVVKFDIFTETFHEIILNSNSVNIPNNYVSDLEGITCTSDNTILVIDNVNRKLHYFNALIFELNEAIPNTVVLDAIDLNIIPDIPSGRIQDKINGYGDWNGFKYLNKFKRGILNENNLTGTSNIFSIYDSTSGKYDLRKINENFDPITQLNSYKFQDYLLDKGDSAFKLMGTFIGTLSSNPNYMGKLIYERISNFTNNIANIDTCNVNALKSMYEMLDESFYTFGNSNLNYPAELNRLIDIFSINFSKLKGSRNKFDENFNSRGYYNDLIIENGGKPLYGFNKGKELDFLTAVLSSGKNIIAFEKFSEEYKILYTNMNVASSKLTYIDPINKTYALSGLNEYWGWGLALPDNFDVKLVPRYYSFYEYISGFNNNQTEGVINWGDPYTTIKENISSIEDWYKIQENIITYSLAKGLGIIK